MEDPSRPPDDPGEPSLPGAAEPPTIPPVSTAAALAPHARGKWPTVIGGVAIVFAVGGVIAALLALASLFFMEAALEMLRTFPGASADDLRDMQAGIAASREWRGVMVTLQVVRGAIATGLFAGGILLILRRRLSAQLLRVWAVLQALLVALSVVVGALIQRGTIAEMGGAPSEGFVIVMTVASTAFGIIWGWALPLFMLIWFARQAISAEVGRWT